MLQPLKLVWEDGSIQQNIIKPELSVITNIGHDHMDLLGDTFEKIAVEKAGIIKKKYPRLDKRNTT